MNKLQARMQQRGEGGFTLIELLVVIAILGILAGVVVFSLTGSSEAAKEGACKTEAATVKTAVVAVNTAVAGGLTNGKDITEHLTLADLDYFTVANPPAAADGKYVAADITTQAGIPAGCDVALILP